ncbi:hypothetical protein Mgra_00007290 [Meloidogyne graminicola]|uniref:Nuclear receptor domain-containing protein n=1 Tax=Meloidogyne graminicola TaxID=189291 RepID=A0A8S9ZIU9_9BILA|nr:hypothetical protein Mgra_00007290 [Meloidogyne graminicola]
MSTYYASSSSSFYELEFNNYLTEKDYCSLEELEKHISKEALLCFSDVCFDVDKQIGKQNILQSLTSTKPKDCIVCGKQAKCCYFDVPCCKGCRSFFRRSVLSQKLFTCKNNENCQILKGERCRACRFDRCLLCGMNFRKIQSYPDGIEIDKINNILTQRKRKLFSREVLTLQNEEISIIMNKAFLSERPEIELLNILDYADECLLHIRHSEIDVSTIYYNKSIFQLLNPFDEENKSILSKTNIFSKKRRIPNNPDYFIQPIQEEKKVYRLPILLYIDSFLFIEMFKTYPILKQLSLEDKIELYSKNGFKTIVFSELFYSNIIHGNEILTFPNGYSPIYNNKDNKIIYNLCYKHTIKIKEANLSKEEFLLLRAAIFFHTASTELSSEGCKILHFEYEKLSQALMFYERNKWGDIWEGQKDMLNW